MSEPLRVIYVAEPPARYLARPPIVVDSSMICAILFDEPERDEARQRLTGRELFAPTVLDHEVINVAVKKHKRGLPTAAVQRALSDYLMHSIALHGTELLGQFEIAQRYGLSSYDAAYLWVATELKAPLATFDRKLAEAARRHLGALE